MRWGIVLRLGALPRGGLAKSCQLAPGFGGGAGRFLAAGLGLAPGRSLAQRLGLEPLGEVEMGLGLATGCLLALLEGLPQGGQLASTLGRAPGCILALDLGLAPRGLLARDFGLQLCDQRLLRVRRPTDGQSGLFQGLAQCRQLALRVGGGPNQLLAPGFRFLPGGLLARSLGLQAPSRRALRLDLAT
jgi:hypothetical protein